MTPEGWRKVGLPDVADLEMGETLIAKDLTGDGLPVFSAGRDPKPWGYTSISRKRFRFGTIVLGARGTIGYPRLPPFPEFVSTQTTIAVSPRAALDPRYLRAALDRIDFDSITAKQAVPMLTIGALRDASLLVPPLGEQRKIAAILSSVDDAIEATQAVIDQLQVVKKAMMAELLTRGLPGRHSCFKTTEIGLIPESWAVKLCGDVFDVQLGKMMSADARSGNNQLPYLRNENVYWHELDLSEVSTMHFEARELEKFRLRPGDLLACEGRHIGRCALWAGELDECYYQKALHRLRAKGPEITTSYMQYFMMLRFRFMSDLVAEANTTSTIPHLPRERLLALPVWFPPRAEQDEIVDVLGAQTDRERSEKHVLAQLQGLKAGLMSVLLTGEVRVKPDDEATA